MPVSGRTHSPVPAERLGYHNSPLPLRSMRHPDSGLPAQALDREQRVRYHEGWPKRPFLAAPDLDVRSRGTRFVLIFSLPNERL
jgi:hypothetical protein